MDLSSDLPTAVDVIDRAGAAITEAGRSHPDAPVAWCGDWTVETVVGHVGQVHSWVTSMLVAGSEQRLPFPDHPDPAPGQGLPDWADERRGALLDAMAATDPDAPVWAFGNLLPARFWWRRQAHETAVHAWDATAPAGSGWEIPGEAGMDGLDEVLGTFVPRIWARHPPSWGEGRTMHFHRTDGPGERLLTIGGGVEETHGDADLEIRGTGGHLVLWALNRPASVELSGDRALAAGWAASVKL